MFDRLDLASPRSDVEKLQANRGVRVGEPAGNPGERTIDGDAEFFLYLAYQRLAHGFSRLDLSAGELPVASVDLAFRALSEQIFGSVFALAQQNCGGNFDDFCHERRWVARVACAPDQSLANCQATRPLRDPRISAQLSASRSAPAISSSSQPNDLSQWATMFR